MSSNGFNMEDGSEARTTPSSNTKRQLSPPVQNLPPLPVVSSSGAARMQGALLRNRLLMNAHQQHHVSIHRPTNPYAKPHLQHQLMGGDHHHHHQAQQQSNAHHLFSQLQPIPPAQIPHPNNVLTTNSQPLQFGINFKGNIIRNGTAFINNHLGNFLPAIYHNRFGNQQQTFQHSLQQHASCLAQNPRMHIQPEPLAAALTAASRSPSSTVCWMTSQPSTASSSNTAPNNCATLPLVGSTEASAPNISNSAPPNPPDMADMPRIMTPQLLPDSARFRGYYTACELLQLKRTLEMRVGCCSIPVPKTSSATTRRTLVKDKRKCMKRQKTGNKINSRASVIIFNEGNGNGQKNDNKEPEQQGQGKEDKLSEQNGKENGEANMEQDLEDLNHVEQMEALNTVQSQETLTPTHADMAPITEIEVIDLTSDGANTPSRDDNDETEDEIHTGQEENGQDQVEKADVEMNNRGNLESNGLTQNSNGQCKSGVTTKTLAMLPLLPPISDIHPKNQLPMGNTTSGAKATSTDADDENHEQPVSVIPSTTAVMMTPPPGARSVHVYTAGYGGPLENRILGSATKFRTSSLVLRVLEIGSCSIRSFSCLNPNRLNVFYKSQRLHYECLLPIARDATPYSSLMRKILRMEISFEQISQIKFGQDNVRMRVEGMPVLTLSNSPALNEPDQVLTPVDKALLEEIDKGQLHLIPTHQLHFLNERLVRQLESQFREHPSLRHLFTGHE